MADFILIYDATDDDLASIGPARADQVGAKAVGVKNTGDLTAQLARLRSSGARVDRMLFYTHGSPGGIKIGLSTILASSVQTYLAGQGFEGLFVPGAHIFFDGCNVAEIKKGCESRTGDPCVNTDNGAVFLMAVAKTFLFKAGGRVGGSTSSGFTLDIAGWYPTKKVLHVTGHVRYALIKPGDTRPRLAAGREMSSPAERYVYWKVRVRDHEFLYSFWEDGRVSWRELEGPPNQPEFGVWRVAGDELQIEWPQSGESETWDLPLFDEFQTGLAFDTLGMDTDLVAWVDVRP